MELEEEDDNEGESINPKNLKKKTKKAKDSTKNLEEPSEKKKCVWQYFFFKTLGLTLSLCIIVTVKSLNNRRFPRK